MAHPICRQRALLGNSSSGNGGSHGLLDSLVLATPVVPVEVAVTLGELGAGVDEVAGEEEVVAGSDGERVAHEGEGVDGEGTGHLARDAVQEVLVSILEWEKQ